MSKITNGHFFGPNVNFCIENHPMGSLDLGGYKILGIRVGENTYPFVVQNQCKITI